MQVDDHDHHCTWSPDGAYVAHTLCTRRKEGVFRSSVSASVVIVSRSSGIRSRRQWQRIRARLTAHDLPSSLKLQEKPSQLLIDECTRGSVQPCMSAPCRDDSREGGARRVHGRQATVSGPSRMLRWLL